VEVTRIVSIQKATAKELASNRLEKTFAICRKFMAHVLDIIQFGITTAIETHARNSSTEDVSETPIDLKRLKIVKLNVLSTTKFVSFPWFKIKTV
jgi:hypothetical protein